MGIHPGQLREYIIRPALEHIGLWSQEAEDLVLGTACQESGCGYYLHQLGKGPAVGIFQMEPASYRDLCVWISSHRKKEWERIWAHTGSFKGGDWPDAERMIWDLRFAAMMCRMFYLRTPEKIPTDLAGQAALYKLRYNTRLGKATPEQYIANWNKHVVKGG